MADRDLDQMLKGIAGNVDKKKTANAPGRPKDQPSERSLQRRARQVLEPSEEYRQISVYLTPEMHRRFKIFAFDKGVPMSKLFIEAMEAYIESNP